MGGPRKPIIKNIIVLLIFAISIVLHTDTALLALPEGWQVESGNATFESPDANTLKITADDKAVLNFHSFSIGENETVNFLQPSASSSVLSRVIGPDASRINGSLNANGILFLSNPNGIYLGPNAQVNVNTLVASTLDIATNNFISQDYSFENGKGKYARILNQGSIIGTNVALIGSAVENTGIIQAKAGSVHLASGDKTTVAIDARGLIQIEVNEATSGKVVDLNTGTTLKDAVSNAGIIEAHQVVMNTKTAADIFENAVNQTGVVRAAKIEEVGGVIRIVSNSNIKVSGTLEAESGKVEVVSDKTIKVENKLNTKGDTTLAANDDIEVNANILTDSGDLELLADYDYDGAGEFKQAAGTKVATVNFGDITIQSSGESTLANVESTGSLYLKQGGKPVTYTQHPDSRITTRNSLSIDKGVTLKAGNALYNIGKNWVSWGNFIPGTSKVSLISGAAALVLGANIFYDFSITEPGKIVRFDS